MDPIVRFVQPAREAAQRVLRTVRARVKRSECALLEYGQEKHVLTWSPVLCRPNADFELHDNLHSMIATLLTILHMLKMVGGGVRSDAGR
jgi:hypothetical protein